MNVRVQPDFCFMQGIIEVINTQKVFRLEKNKADSQTFFTCVILWINSVVSFRKHALACKKLSCKNATGVKL